jgi:hypothetical protein
MPWFNLMALSLTGILVAAAQASAQEESHVLTQESAADVQPVQEPPAVTQQGAGRSGAGNQGRQGYSGGRAPAPRPGVREPGNDRSRVVAAPAVVYRGTPNRYVYSGRYLPSRPVVYGSGYLYYGPGFGYFGPGFGVHYGNYYGGYYGWPGSYAPPADYGQAHDVGELRLRVSPKTAKVFVDGGYAGTVDDFDGTFQALKLESGSYAIRLEAPGYETIEFDVRITPTQKVTYQETLRPR